MKWKEKTQWWFQCFNTGEENTKDLPCSRRSKLLDIEKICWVLKKKFVRKYSSAVRRICCQLIGNPMDDKFIRRIVTCDEKWVYYQNPNASKQWLSPRQLAKVIVKKNQFGSKVMFCVWYNFVDVIHWEFVPDRHAIVTDLYLQQVERIHEILRRKYPAFVNRNIGLVLLKQDNLVERWLNTIKSDGLYLEV